MTIDTKKLKEAADAVMADIASKKNGSIWPSGQIPILFIPGTPGMDYVVNLRPEVVDELLARLEKAEARTEWLMRNVSGAEFKRLGIVYSAGCTVDDIDVAMKD